MKVSVLMPVYNTREYLTAAAESVLSQAGELELILVDDGSTDGSGAVCDALAERDVRVKAVHQPNAFVGAARNRALREATGDYVYFLDSDDTMAPDALARIDGLTGDVITAREKRFSDGRRKRAAYKGEDLRAQILWFSPYLGQSFYRRDWLEKLGIMFSEERKTAEDCEWLFSVLQHAGQITVCEGAFYTYRVSRAGSLCTAYRKSYLKPTLDTWKKLYDSVETSAYPEKDAMRAYCADGLVQHCVSAALCGEREWVESCLPYLKDRGCKVSKLLPLRHLFGTLGLFRLLNLRFRLKQPR